jgi:hypothetical protein
MFGDAQVIEGGRASLNGQSAAVGEFLAGPAFAATWYGATLQTTPVSRVLPPMITSPWFGQADANGNSFVLDVPYFTVERGGWFGIPGLFSETVTYHWRGIYQYAPPWDGVDPSDVDGRAPTVVDPSTMEVVETPEPTTPRRWIDGFENPTQGESGTAAGTGGVSRDASRHVEGWGMALRSQSETKTHTIIENGATASTESWERFYFRIRQLPNTTTNFFRTHGGTSSLAGLILGITTDSKLTAFNCSSSDVRDLIGTTPTLEANRWYRCDVMLKYGTSAYARIYIDKSLAINGGSFGTVGLGQAQNHANSVLGDIDTQLPTTKLGLDLDDWRNAEVPAALTGLDWHNGSKIVRVIANDFGATNGTFVGDIQTTMQRPTDDANGVAGLTSSTSEDRLELDVDVEALLRSQRGYVGVAAVYVSRYGKRLGSGQGQIGYTTNGGADVLTALTGESSTANHRGVIYQPTPGEFWPDLREMQLLYIKAADTDLATIYEFSAVAEVLGVWGPEDIADAAGTDMPVEYARRSRIHNAPYPASPWATSLAAPISPVAVVAGTYVGTGSGKDLTFNYPVTWLFIRRVSTLGPSTHWWTTKLAGKTGHGELVTPDTPVDVGTDPTYAGSSSAADPEFRYRVRIAGGRDQSNKSGDTYQYIAFCDPGMRFSMAGVLAHSRDAATKDTPLIDEDFLPEFGFFAFDEINGSTAAGDFFKGMGHGAAVVSPLIATETVDAATFSLANIETQSALHDTAAPQVPFIVFRHDDGSEDEGIPRVIRQFSFTGDGTASRVLSINLGERRPMWALVTPHDGASFFRDPSNTGTTSNLIATGSYSSNAATAIIAGGINSITVGVAANALGIVYDVLIFPGSEDAGENGWSTNGEFIPVAPDIAPGTQWDEQFPPWGLLDIILEDVDVPEDIDTDLEEDCLPFTSKVCDRALSHVGISQRTVNVGTDNTVEGEMLRLHYTEDVIATLRDFPWPFATGYASVEATTLDLVDGSLDDPSNPDWIYTYRAPTDCVFVRRVVNEQTRREYDSNPIKFRMRSDSEGDLIDTDQEDAVIEYTRRPPCAAGNGDAIYREALSWRLAAHLAPTLSRNKVTAAECMQMYRYNLGLARQAAANEGQPAKDGDASWIEDRN